MRRVATRRHAVVAKQNHVATSARASKLANATNATVIIGGRGVQLGGRNGTPKRDPSQDLFNDVPLHREDAALEALAQRFARNPSELARLLVKLHHRGVPLDGARAPLDKGSERGTSSRRGGRRKKKDWRKVAEHDLFASEVTRVMPARGALIWITFGTPPAMPRRELLERFAKFCDSSGFDYVAVLEWGECPTDPHRARGKGDGEHIHAIVLAPDRDAFIEQVHEWADAEGIGRRSRNWTIVTGWSEYVVFGDMKKLHVNVGNVIAYATKPSKEQPQRDLRADSIASGIFMRPWRRLVRNATGGPARSVTRCCRLCGDALTKGATVRRKFCSDVCRVEAHRHPERLLPTKWIVHPRP